MSRIHEALKKAEAERAKAGMAGTSDPHARTETPLAHRHVRLTSTSPSAASSGVDSRTVVPGSGSPSLFGVTWPPEKGTLRDFDDDGANLSLARDQNKAERCVAALLEQCSRFDWAPASRRALSSKRGRFRIGAEEFRTLRSNLDLVRKQQPLKTLLITSPLPREGKTFVAVNLSRALVWRREHRVLLIDGDLRVSQVHRSFDNMPSEPGLADYLRDGVDPISVIRRGPGDNFFILPAGRSVSNPLEFIGNGRLRALLQWLAPAFDWIVVDSPPAIPVSDARLIAECSDGILLVVKAGHTPFDLTQRLVGEIRGKRYLGFVLNAVDPALSASSYYYGESGNGAHRKQTS